MPKVPDFPPPPAYMRNSLRGRRCFVVATGPSLDKMDLQPLRNEITVGCSRIFLNAKINFPLKYLVFTDHRVLPFLWTTLNAWWKARPGTARFFMRPDGSRKFSDQYRTVARSMRGPRTFWFRLNQTKFAFSRNATRNVTVGVSVTYAALQFAYWLGCNPVYLIGCDSTPSGHFKNSIKKDYFVGQKKKMIGDRRLIRPLDGSLLKLYMQYFVVAKRQFAADKRCLYNATIGGRLDVFKRVKYASLFGK